MVSGGQRLLQGSFRCLTQEAGTGHRPHNGLGGHPWPRSLISGGPDKAVWWTGVVCFFLPVSFFSLTFTAVVGSPGLAAVMSIQKDR